MVLTPFTLSQDRYAVHLTQEAMSETHLMGRYPSQRDHQRLSIHWHIAPCGSNPYISSLISIIGPLTNVLALAACEAGHHILEGCHCFYSAWSRFYDLEATIRPLLGR